jgi:hypothetical protein
MSCRIGHTLWMALLLLGPLVGLQNTASAAHLYSLQGTLVAPVVSGSIDFSQLTGNVSHLGNVVVTGLNGSTPTWVVNGGTLTTVVTSQTIATSIDFLTGTGSVEYAAELAITGGTGKYANASGFIDLSGSTFLPASSITFDVFGGLALP